MQLENVWRFQHKYPVFEGPIELETEAPLKLDSRLGTVSFGDLITFEMGLHAICEQMARAAEYNARTLMILERQEHDVEEGANSAEKIDKARTLPDIAQEVYPRIQPASSLLYSIPAIWSNQQKDFDYLNIGTFYALLCGWIVLLTPAEDIGRQYIQMLEEGVELARDIYHSERARIMNGDSFNGIRMADAICNHFRLTPFSEALQKHIATLSALLELHKPEHPNIQPKTNIFWYINDGIYILRFLQEKPQRFLLPVPVYESNKEYLYLPRPPVLYRDTFLMAEPHGMLRTNHHVILAMQKEILFCSHSIDTNSPLGLDVKSNECVYKSDCIFNYLLNCDPVARDYVQYLLHHVLAGNSLW